MEHLVIDIAVCIVAAWLVAVAFQVIRQPLLLAYLVAGFAIGPHGFRWIENLQSIKTISSIGLILLLFLIGLEIDLKKMMSAGKVITLTAGSQIVGCLLLGWFFFKSVGPAVGWLEAFYLGVAASLSSTVIIVKILYDKHELETLSGRITLGILVIQDLFAILFLAVQPNLKDPSFQIMVLALGKVLLLVAVALMASRYVLPPVFKSVARLPELVLVGALAWCFAVAGFAHWLGLSHEMGALVAGVAISTFPYTLDVVAKVTSIRDFFVTLFFVGLGMTIPVPTLQFLFWMVIVSLFIVGSRLVTVFPPLYLMKQGHRVSLLPAINLCQLSELSLVLLTLGHNAGDVSEGTVSIAAFAFAFLAVDSTYAIFKNEAILQKTTPWLTRLWLPDLGRAGPEFATGDPSKRIYVLGFFSTASSLLEEIDRARPALLKDIAVVDFNPHVYEKLRRRGVKVIYGDITQRDVLLHAGIAHAEIIVCSLPDSILKGATNMKLLRQLRELNSTARIIVHAEKLGDAAQLTRIGAGYVSIPRLLEADELLKAIEAAEKGLLDQKQGELLERLEDRDEVVP